MPHIHSGFTFNIVLVLIISILYIIYRHRCAYDVRVVPGEYKIRKRFYLHEGIKHQYYVLYTCEKLLWNFHYYRIMGNGSIEYKFNNPDDASKYYEATINKK